MKDFPDGFDIMSVLEAAHRPLTTIEVHVEARKSLGLAAPHTHGTAATLVRLNRLFNNGLVATNLVGEETRVWYPIRGYRLA